jgi:hypothetical protein
VGEKAKRKGRAGGMGKRCQGREGDGLDERQREDEEGRIWLALHLIPSIV